MEDLLGDRLVWKSGREAACLNVLCHVDRPRQRGALMPSEGPPMHTGSDTSKSLTMGICWCPWGVRRRLLFFCPAAVTLLCCVCVCVCVCVGLCVCVCVCVCA